MAMGEFGPESPQQMTMMMTRRGSDLEIPRMVVRDQPFRSRLARRAAELAGQPIMVIRDRDGEATDLEGYLFPETYRFAEGLAPADILREMVVRYQAYWTPERRARLDSLSLDERGLVTLASIVEEEARVGEERPIIAGVYTNRLEIGMLLQADPTVQYALGEPKARLLFADIDRVADDPYNTYTHPGLPPGPIASPGASSLDAALYPADVPYLFFVARPDGSHEFTRTNREHVNARNRIRREQGQ